MEGRQDFLGSGPELLRQGRVEGEAALRHALAAVLVVGPARQVRRHGAEHARGLLVVRALAPAARLVHGCPAGGEGEGEVSFVCVCVEALLGHHQFPYVLRAPLD